MIPWIPEAMAAAGMAAVLRAGLRCVWLCQRSRSAWRSEVSVLWAELGRVRVDSLAEIGRLGKEIEAWKRESQAGAEFCEGQLSATARSRAMRMLRAGIAPEAAASELGMARSEVELLKEVAVALLER